MDCKYSSNFLHKSQPLLSAGAIKAQPSAWDLIITASFIAVASPAPKATRGALSTHWNFILNCTHFRGRAGKVIWRRNSVQGRVSCTATHLEHGAEHEIMSWKFLYAKAVSLRVLPCPEDGNASYIPVLQCLPRTRSVASSCPSNLSSSRKGPGAEEGA